MSPLALEIGGVLDVDLAELGETALLLAIAYVLALPIAHDREASRRSAGLRTFPLVAVASCAMTIIAHRALADDPATLGRMMEGIVTGVGFLGGGAILRMGDHVEGTATAASIWGTAASGIAVGYGAIDVALLILVANLVTFKLVGRLKERFQPATELEGAEGGDRDGAASP